MPTGCLMPLSPSISNSWGRTWITSRSAGIATAWACSITRRTSARCTSRPLIATIPISLYDSMCPPAMPANTALISQPAISSASSNALRIESVVASMSTTTPRRRPRDGCEPIPITSIESPLRSATTAQILVVPTSSPTISSSLRAIRISPLAFGLDAAKHCAPLEAQVDLSCLVPGEQAAGAQREPVAQVAVRLVESQGHVLARRLDLHALGLRVDARQRDAARARGRQRLQRPRRVAAQLRQTLALGVREREARALRVDAFERLRVERHRLAFGDADHEPRRRDARRAGARDARVRRQRRLDGVGIHVDQRAARRDPGGLPERPGLERARTHEVHVAQRQRRPAQLGAQAVAVESGLAQRLRSEGADARQQHAADPEREPAPRHHRSSPMICTSVSSSTPKRSFTAPRARAISSSTSAARALLVTMKLACSSEICAPPKRRPLSPAASIRRPAKSPGGFLKTEPHEG